MLLYEMATGERPFKGETTVSTLSAILRDTPRPVNEVNPQIPRDLARVVKLCLAKDRERRYQSVKDLRNELEALKQESDSGELAALSAVARPRHRLGRRLALGTVAVAIVGCVAASWFALRGTGLGGARPTAVAASYLQLTGQRGVEAFPSLSPDGKWLVYQSELSGNWDIYLQSVAGQNPINLTRDLPEADYQPAFSPDGQTIAFGSARRGGGLFVMGMTGENVRRIADAGFDPAWSPTGEEIAYATLATSVNPYDRSGISELWVLNLKNGEKRRLYEGDAMQPRWSPHGTRIAFWRVPVGTSRRDIFTIPAAGGKPVPVTAHEALHWSPAWAPDGSRLAGATGRGIATYDVKSKQYEVLTDDGGVWPAAWLNDGRRMLYLTQGHLKVVDRQSRVVQDVLSVAPDTLGLFTIPRDNRRLYIVRSSNESDIWLATLK